MKKLALVSLVVLSAVPASAMAARGPTYLEKVTIMDAFNIPGRSFSSKCVRIVVSTVDPRWAIVTSPIHTPKACVQAGEEGNGWSLYHRANPSALHWAHVDDGDGDPCQLPAAPRRDIFKTTTCG